ncbi:MAG TPA: TetR/AcrR family transcriptional regulator [Sandaracinaceae bacterium LLY-WYZ-13_1]|nr:TetR/AcrR family transcriptional regulator [Sandaracinaceae bacterium LLY-WYZ-13_1]
MKKGESTRRAILDDALAQASVLGLDGLTIGTLARRTGMSKSGLFAHFRSKEGLQIQVLEEARDRFVSRVVSPALKHPRGEPRVRALFERWMDWEAHLPGGCPFIPAASELDDQQGPVREHLVDIQRDWVDTLRAVARTAVREGDFRADLDVAQWAFELWGLVLSYHWYARLLEADDAVARVRAGFESLLERARA